MAAVVASAVEACRALGAELVEHAAPPRLELELLIGMILAEFWVYHRTQVDRADRYRPSIAEAVDRAGGDWSAADYVAGQARRDRQGVIWQRWMTEHGADLVLEPVAVNLPLVRGAGYDSGAMQRDPSIALTIEWNATGFPVATLPGGLGPRSGLPVGISLIARAGDEATAVRAAIALQAEALAPPAIALG